MLATQRRLHRHLHSRFHRRLHLLKRGEAWHFRRRVPLDLVPLLRRAHVIRSLHTTTFRQACRRAALLNAQLERIFAEARRAKALGEVVDAEELISKLCDEYLERLLTEDREDRRTRSGLGEVTIQEQASAYRELIEDEGGRMLAGDRSRVAEEAREMLKASGETLSEAGFDRLLWELQRTFLRVLRIAADEWEGDFAGLSREDEQDGPRYAPSALEPASPSATKRPTLQLSDVIAAHVTDKEGKKSWTAKTGGMIKSELARFLEIVGDKQVGEVTRDDIRRYVTTLQRLPARMALFYPGKSVAEVLAMNPKPGLSPASINKFMSHVHGLFDFAETMDWVERNPVVRGLKMPTNRREAKHKRAVFTDEDLAAIFSRSYRAETLERGHYAKYWVPLLCLYTGARLEEMSQLRPEDVVELDGIPAIRISFGEGQRLKNAGSERTVPIHPQLVEPLGFLRFVREARQRGDRRLYPELTKHTNGYGDAVSKWFSRWLRGEARIEDRRKVLHSFRHTVATRLSHADVQVHTIAELLGHEYAKDGTTTTRVYAKEDPNMLKKLAEALEKLDYREALGALTSSS